MYMKAYCRLWCRTTRPTASSMPPAKPRDGRNGHHECTRRGLKPEKTFLGLELTSRRDVLLFMVAEARAREILERIQEAGRFEAESGAGVAFQIGRRGTPWVWARSCRPS